MSPIEAQTGQEPAPQIPDAFERAFCFARRAHPGVPIAHTAVIRPTPAAIDYRQRMGVIAIAAAVLIVLGWAWRSFIKGIERAAFDVGVAWTFAAMFLAGFLGLLSAIIWRP